MTRGSHLTPAHQSHAGKGRATQASFLTHNQQIAPDGFAAMSAYMRAPAGLRLLDPAHIQFLRPEQIAGKQGRPLSPPEKRLQFGVYVWRMVWEHVPSPPPPPTDEEYLYEMQRIQALIGQGQPLSDPLDGVYAAPNDFRDSGGNPFSWKKQRKLFREALKAACAAAVWRNETPRKVGQRRPLYETPASLMWSHAPRKDVQIGRQDVPSYARENLSPARPYSVPVTATTHAIWLPPTNEQDKQDE